MRRRRSAAATEAGGPSPYEPGRETVPVEGPETTGPDPAFLDDLSDDPVDGPGPTGEAPSAPAPAWPHTGEAGAPSAPEDDVPAHDPPAPAGWGASRPGAYAPEPNAVPAPSPTASPTPGRASPPPAPPVVEADFAELRDDAGEGDGLVRANVWVTVVFVVVAALAAAFPDPLEGPFVVVSLALFAAGCAAFVWGFAKGIGRSRDESVSLGGLFFLGGDVAPSRVRRSFQLLLAVQVVASVAAAVVRPFTPLAFGVLVPTLGIGLMALWGARHGTFPPRPDGPRGPTSPEAGH